MTVSVRTSACMGVKKSKRWRQGHKLQDISKMDIKGNVWHYVEMYRFGADYGPMEESVNMDCLKGGGFLESP